MDAQQYENVQAGLILDDPVGSALHLVVDAAKVFTENSEANELNATEKKSGNDQRGDPVWSRRKSKLSELFRKEFFA